MRKQVNMSDPLKKRGLTREEHKQKKNYENAVEKLYVKLGCVVEKEHKIATYRSGKLFPIPHDLFNRSSDVVSLCIDGTHLSAVTSGQPENVVKRKNFFDGVIPVEYPGICEIFHFAENNEYTLVRRNKKGVWENVGLNAVLISNVTVARE